MMYLKSNGGKSNSVSPMRMTTTTGISAGGTRTAGKSPSFHGV